MSIDCVVRGGVGFDSVTVGGFAVDTIAGDGFGPDSISIAVRVPVQPVAIGGEPFNRVGPVRVPQDPDASVRKPHHSVGCTPSLAVDADV